jgi:hypothetical protein
MGSVRRMDMNKFRQPVYKAGEIAEKSVGIKEPPINQVGKTPPRPVLPRPNRGKRPPVKGEPLPVPPPIVKIPEQGMDKEKPTAPEEMITDVDAVTTVEQPKRRRRRAQDQSLVNTSNLLGTGGSL